MDRGIEWVPAGHSLLAAESYRGFDGVRRFWGELLSTWESELELDQTQSSRLTVRDGRVVRVQAFADPKDAREAAGLPPYLLRRGAILRS